MDWKSLVFNRESDGRSAENDKCFIVVFSNLFTSLKVYGSHCEEIYTLLDQLFCLNIDFEKNWSIVLLNKSTSEAIS